MKGSSRGNISLKPWFILQVFGRPSDLNIEFNFLVKLLLSFQRNARLSEIFSWARGSSLAVYLSVVLLRQLKGNTERIRPVTQTVLIEGTSEMIVRTLYDVKQLLSAEKTPDVVTVVSNLSYVPSVVDTRQVFDSGAYDVTFVPCNGDIVKNKECDENWASGLGASSSIRKPKLGKARSRAIIP